MELIRPQKSQPKPKHLIHPDTKDCEGTALSNRQPVSIIQGGVEPSKPQNTKEETKFDSKTQDDEFKTGKDHYEHSISTTSKESYESDEWQVAFEYQRFSIIY